MVASPSTTVGFWKRLGVTGPKGMVTWVARVSKARMGRWIRARLWGIPGKTPVPSVPRGHWRGELEDDLVKSNEMLTGKSISEKMSKIC